ncbi:MAG: ABC transporter substrate-binding protein [Actinobacteria bacterium]|nr:ABC transporter substrate-binding protein [Actinomycetota bacterium]
MRRKALALVLILGFIAAACGGDDDDTSPAAQPSAQPNLEAEMRVAAPEDQWPDNGPDAKSWQFMYVHNMNVYEPLVYLGSDYTLQPGLAERWELQPDGKTWRFFLRRNVRFQDGAPFSADDVVWSWGVRQLEGKVLTTVTNTLGPESVKKVDDFTVDFTPAQQNLRIPEQIVHPEGAIVKNGTHNDTPPYAGTGPWKVVSYTPKQNAVFERNEDYWGEKPKVKRINIRFLPDPQTRLEALRAKQVDFVIDLPADATAIDRRAYVDVVLEGNGEPGRWMAPKSVLGPGADTVAAIPLDVGRARKILDDAGWRVGPDGVRTKGDKRLSLILLGQFEVPESALLVIQSNLKEAGMEVTLKKTPDAATRNALYDRGNGDFDLDIEPPNQNDGNPAFLPVLRMYSKGTNTVQFAPNSPPITPNGPEFDAQAEKALAAKTTPEVQQASAAMMRILSNQDHIVVPLAGVYRIYGMAKNVNLGDPHPSFTNQRWVSLTMSSSN